jgi:TRAP transporter TAXI family solute receptor
MDRRTLTAALVAAATALAAGAAAAQQMSFFRIGTGGAGGTYYPVGGILATAISNPPGSRPCEKGGACGVPGLVATAVSSDGSVANVNGIVSGQLEAGIAQSDVAHWAYTGTGLFEGKPRLEKLRAIANLFPEHIHVFTRADSKVMRIEDLKGKKVNFGPPASGTLIGARLFFEAYGLKEGADLAAEFLQPGPGADRVRDSQLDASFIIVGYPAAAITELAATAGARILPIAPAMQDTIVQKVPFWAKAVIPAGTYKGQDQDVPTVAVGAQLLTSADQPEKLVYEVTKALWNDNTRTLLDAGHAKGKAIQKATALAGVSLPLHPGAERFYREAGLLK